MSKRTRILLYGNSLILGGIGASLRAEDRFEVIGLSPPFQGRRKAEAIAPDVILFDQENGHPEAAFSLLRAHPSLLLLGVSPDGNVVQVWSGHQYHELTTTDLTALIEAGLGPAD
jgi:hypothetical protein